MRFFCYIPPFVVFVLDNVCERFLFPDSGVVGRCFEFYSRKKKNVTWNVKK